MWSATLAAFAPPEWLSAGIIVSDNSSTSVYCAGGKNRVADLVSPAFPCDAAGVVSAWASSEGTPYKGKSDPPRTVAEVFSHWRRSCFRLIGPFVDIGSPYSSPD